MNSLISETDISAVRSEIYHRLITATQRNFCKMYNYSSLFSSCLPSGIKLYKLYNNEPA